MRIEFDFTGQRVLVTGAHRGIGRAVAGAFARAGADVIAVGEAPGVHETGAESSHALDITDASAAAATIGRLGPLDILVNNAGIEIVTPILDSSETVDADFRRTIELNVMGTFHVTRAALPLMGPGGRILFTASTWGKMAEPLFSAYSASKHAVIGFMRSIARELGPHGIRANAVCPGWVDSPAHGEATLAMAAATGQNQAAITAEAAASAALRDTPMVAADLAATYLFLASPAAAHITGQAINVDRGEVML